MVLPDKIQAMVARKDLLHTTVVLAMSADGKISDRGRSPARFGSAADQAHLEAQVALADVVLFGAGTLQAYGTTMSVRERALKQGRQERGQSSQPVQMVCSLSGELDASAKFFDQPVPRWLLTSQAGATRWQRTNHFEQVLIAPQLGNGGIDWPQIWRDLDNQNINRLAVLGGGQLTAALFEAELVDELWLTICPLVLGGERSPTPADGQGFLAAQAPQLKLSLVKQLGEELLIHYKVLARARRDGSEA